MHRTRLTTLFLCAALLPVLAWAADGYDDGDKLPEDKGVLMFKVVREKQQGGAVVRRGAWQLEMRTASGKRLMVGNPTKLKAFLVEPGRYFFYALRQIEGGTEYTGMSGPSEALVVEAGKVSWAGTIHLEPGASGTRIYTEQGAEAKAELLDKFPDAVKAGIVQRVDLGAAPVPLE